MTAATNKKLTYFIKDGPSFFPTDHANIDIRDHLPLGTYSVGAHPMKGWYLETIEDLVVPPVLYGSVPATATRIMRTFIERPVNTGVLLAGEKGSGKTMLMRKLSIMAREMGIPTLLINSQYAGESFNKLMASIHQPVVVCYDEFEKVYDDDHQQQILTLLDGVFTSKKLFLFTVNQIGKVNSHMKNRPGRLFYNLSYQGLEEEAVRGYCNDTLVNKEHLEGLLTVAKGIDAFNFDMLKALVEEMNRYQETAQIAVKMLNIRPEKSSYVNFTCKAVMLSNPKLPISVSADSGNPLSRAKTGVHVVYATGEKIEQCMGDEDDFHPDELKRRYKNAYIRNKRVYVMGDETAAKQLELTMKDIVVVENHTAAALGDICFRKDGFEFTFERRTNTEFAF